MVIKLRHSSDFVARQKELILKELAKLEEDQVSNDDENENFNHQADGIFDKIKTEAFTLTARQQKRKKDLFIALGKIETGEYGICEKSRKLISEERLKAVPEARFSVQETEKEEKKLNGQTVLLVH